MTTVNEVYKLLDKKFPYSLAESWDNSGIICGSLSAPVKRVLVSLDITFAVIEEAERLGCQLIVSHHPVVFSPIKSVTDSGYTEKKLLMLLEKKIAAISCHTNLDAAAGGVNDLLAETLELSDIVPTCKMESGGFLARMGQTKISDLKEFSLFVKKQLNCPGLRYVDGGKLVKNVAVIGGSGGSYYEEILKSGADTLVTGDAKYSNFLPAMENGLNLIDAGHFSTENIVVKPLSELIRTNLDTEVVESSVHSDCVFYL